MKKLTEIGDAIVITSNRVNGFPCLKNHSVSVSQLLLWLSDGETTARQFAQDYDLNLHDVSDALLQLANWFNQNWDYQKYYDIKKIIESSPILASEWIGGKGNFFPDEYERSNIFNTEQRLAEVFKASNGWLWQIYIPNSSKFPTEAGMVSMAEDGKLLADKALEAYGILLPPK